MKKYVCDFETTTDPKDCRVWAYGFCNIDNLNDCGVGTNIDEFFEWCKKDNKTIYFHNLKFDGEFIVSYLLQNNFKYDEEHSSNTFSCLVSNMNQFYSIDIYFERKGKYVKHLKILDSLKKLPFKVEKIAKDFNLPINKLKIDYNKKRSKNHKLTTEEINYILNDVKIVAMALQYLFNQNLNKITTGSDALNYYKNTISYKNWSRNFPILDLETDKDIRQAYRGGFTYLNEKFKNKMLGNGIVFDVNSLYPSVMYYKPLPIGEPLFFEGKYKKDILYPLYIQKLSCSFKLRKNYIPTIQLKNNLNFIPTEYIKESKDEVTLILSSVDLELFINHYDVENIVYHCGWKFQSSTNLFKDYIDYWINIKNNNTGAIKQIAKLMLNSLYGKFGTNPDVTGKYPILNNDNIVEWKMKNKEYRDPVYIPLAIFVTAWARYKTISTAQKCFDRFIYADTDSLHLIGSDIPDIIKNEIDDKKLGFWKHESTFEKAKFIRQKTYVEKIGNEFNVKCAGMPDQIKNKINLDNFKTGFSSYGKLLPKRVKNGVILKDTIFTIK